MCERARVSNQQTFYVQLSRARENAVVLTDNREQLVETLEANTGERITALDAWLDEAERTLAPHPHATTAPDFADGYAYEDWHRALETLVTRGRTAVPEAVDSGAVEPQAAARARGAMQRLERLLGERFDGMWVLRTNARSMLRPRQLNQATENDR